MKNPLVSVIIPTYNRAEMLPNSVNSVINQTYKNLEIIVVDDGSTDNTKEVVKKFKDKRIKYFKKRNGGPSSAQNYGIKKTKGKYITMLADDDEYLLDKVKLQVEFMQKHRNLVFCYCNVFLKTDSDMRLFLDKPAKNAFLDLLIGRNFISAPAVMIKTKILKSSGGFDTSLEVAEDYDLWLRITKKHKRFAYIDMPLAIVTTHELNLSKDIKKMSYFVGIVKLKHFKEFKGVIPNDKKRDFETELNYQKGKRFLYESDYALSRKYLKKTILLNPTNPRAYMLFIISLLQTEKFTNTLLSIISRFEFSRFKKA